MVKRWIAILLVLAATLGMTVTAGAAQTGSQTDAQSPATETAAAADPAGALSFQNLESRMRAGNYNLLSCAESIASVKALERKAAYEDLVEANNALSDLILYLYQSGNSVAASQYQEQQRSLRKQLDTLKPEEYEKTYQENIRQIAAVENQIIFGAQTLYITVLGLEQSLAEGNRGLAALGRGVAELEMRYQLGQVSELNLLSLKKTYASTQSQLTTLSMQITNLKSQLQTMVGADPTGQLTLLPLPETTDESIAAMDFSAGLTSGLASSMDLYWKNEDVIDAKKAWNDAAYGYARTMAEHTHQSKVYASEAAKQSFALTYGNLYRAVFDQKQILAAAQSALSYEQQNYLATQKKYELGMISENAWKDAGDALASAEDAVTKARTALSSAYNSYEWATRGVIAG